jgi:glycosyltransferase involved in cell wall biosynthesis
MDGLSNRGFDCLFLQHDIEKDRFLFEGKDVGDLGAFLRRCGVDTVVNQNGFSNRLTELLAATRWQGRYIVCHHNEPRFLRKVYDSHRCVSEVFNGGSPPKVRLAWFIRLLGYPIWRKWSDGRITKTQGLNYRRCDRYVLLSPSFLPEFSQLIGQRKTPKAIAIPNPLSFEVTSEEAGGFVKKREALMVTRLDEPQKRISTALMVWQAIEKDDRDGWTLKIIGDGPDAAALRDMARKMGLKRVVFLNRQDPLPHFKSASIFFMTSRAEGWGVTLTEAMQTGTVPIAFDAYASLRDIVDHGETGIIVRNGDIAAFAKETIRLMEEAARRQAMATRALEACQRYRLEAVLDQWVEIL